MYSCFFFLQLFHSIFCAIQLADVGFFILGLSIGLLMADGGPFFCLSFSPSFILSAFFSVPFPLHYSQPNRAKDCHSASLHYIFSIIGICRMHITIQNMISFPISNLLLTEYRIQNISKPFTIYISIDSSLIFCPFSFSRCCFIVKIVAIVVIVVVVVVIIWIWWLMVFHFQFEYCCCLCIFFFASSVLRCIHEHRESREFGRFNNKL